MHFDQPHLHRLAGGGDRQIHGGEGAGKASPHRVSRPDSSLLEQPDAEGPHIRAGGGPFGLQRPQGGGDSGVALPQHACLVVVQLLEGNAQLLFITLDLLKTAVQQLGGLELDAGVFRLSLLSAHQRQGQGAVYHQGAGQQQVQHPAFPPRPHIGNTCIPCPVIIRARMPTTTARAARDLTIPCFSISWAAMPGISTPIIPGS